MTLMAKCPVNTIFDEQSSTCLHPSLATCTETNDVTNLREQRLDQYDKVLDSDLLDDLESMYDCSGLKDGFYPDLLSKCSRFFECSSGRMDDLLQCPTGSTFDMRTDACVLTSSTTCPGMQSKAHIKTKAIEEELAKVPQTNRREETRQIKFKRLVDDDQKLIRDIEALVRVLERA